jgi:MFS family permease
MPSAIAFGPYFGGLADRWGRRPVYSIALTGLLLQLVALYVVCKCSICFNGPVLLKCRCGLA